MTRLVLVACAIMVIAGCRPAPPPPPTTTAPPATPTALPADALAGTRFVSVEEREVGMGPDGEAMGHWVLVFDEDTVTWLYSDIAEQGPYELHPDGTITAQLGAEGTIDATYDAARDRVRWDGMWYERGQRDT